MVLTVNFDASASQGGDTETITAYNWNFGDGYTSTGVATSHTYASPAQYNVTLTVTNSCGNSNSLTQCILVQPELCDWIDAVGGPAGLSIPEIFVLVDSYLFSLPPSGYTFIPIIPQIMGVVDYYLGFNGDATTGCDYYV